MSLPPDVIAELFRHRYARLIASLCSKLGPGRLDLVEDVVQEALARALRVWPAEGVPDNPEAWVFRVAQNLALDALRRRRVELRVDDELQRRSAGAVVPPPEPDDPERIADDTLRMLFLCAHPAVPVDARLPLLLKTVCGFGVPAIARALLQKDATIAQRLVRAKAKLQGGDVQFAMPAPADLPARLEQVLQVIYLVFNEGYRAHAGDALVRTELVEEALRLSALVLERPATATPAAHALMALQLLLGARMPARVDGNGDLVPLARQDRSLWHHGWIALGFEHFRRSIGGPVLTAYHCEAAIASVHAAAVRYDATDWARILREYDRLLQVSPSPVVRLNRAVAVGKVHGAAAGLQALAGLHDDKALDDYFLLGAVTAQLHWERGDCAAAARELRSALAQPCSEPERRLLAQRLAACERGESSPPW